MKARVALALALVPASASAQVRYDVGVLAGYTQRVADVAEGANLTVDGHVALLPLLRVGGYLNGEVSARTYAPASGFPSTQPYGVAPRGIFDGGLSIKIVPPWPRAVWRAWLRTGFGYGGVIPTDRGSGGGFLEVPVCFGASYRIRKPIVFLMELGARFGFAFWGSYYDPSGGAGAFADGVALSLSLGIGIDR